MRLRSRIEKVERRLGANQPRFFVIYPCGGPDGCLTKPPGDIREDDVVVYITFGDNGEADSHEETGIRMRWPDERVRRSSS